MHKSIVTLPPNSAWKLSVLAVAMALPSVVFSANDYQPSLIGFAQVDGFIEVDLSGTFTKDGEKLVFEDDGKTLNVVIDEDLQGYTASMDSALVWVNHDTTINFTVDNEGRGLTFLRNENDKAVQSGERFAMVDASTRTSTNKVCVNFDLGGGTLTANQGSEAVLRLSGNDYSELTFANGSLNLFTDDSDYAKNIDAGIYLVSETRGGDSRAMIKATENIQNISLVNKSATFAKTAVGIKNKHGNLYLTAQETLAIVGVDENGEQDYAMRWNTGLLNYAQSETILQAKYLIIDAATAIAAQDEGSVVRIAGEKVQLNGNIYAYGGSDIEFEKLEGKNHLVSVISSAEDAVLVNPYADGAPNSTAKVAFNTNTVINAQKDQSIEYADASGIRTVSAIRALRLADVQLNDAGSTYQIYGDIIAGRGVEKDNAYGNEKGGTVTIGGAGSIIRGDVLAGNTGTIALNLSGGASFEGRVDDYNDAGKTGKDGQDMVFRPAEFDVDVSEAGTVNLTIADSTWTARHRNFVTELNFAGSDAAKNFIDLSTDGNSSLTIQKLSGSGTIKMKLSQAKGSDGAHLSDMLYVGELGQDAHINIELDTSDIESYEELTDLRFATTGGDFFSESEGASAISARIENVGFFNRNLNIYTEAYSNDTDADRAKNEAYNGEGDGSTAPGEAGGKPGQDYVHDMFGDGVSTNWYIGDEKSGTDGGVISEAGQTILATARATYWNAVILDRFNQRYGDRVYDQNHNGVWARVKYEHIGTDAGVGDFSSDNTTYQFGYDYTKPTENGKMIWGGAIDYMNGRTDYKSINGDGGTDRIGALLYATYLADNGAYTDLVLRAGRLSADYQMSTPSGTKLDADYNHWMYGISFEAGHQLENGTGWFLEPQLQAQYTRITDGDYRNQQTRVEQDAIDSLITRAGFRVGKFLSDSKATLGYFKADVMREWMGEQDIRVYDVTTAAEGADVSLSNHGTWFDVGGGFQAAVTQDLYAYGDVEYRFGNDFDNTWIVNIGAKYRF